MLKVKEVEAEVKGNKETMTEVIVGEEVIVEVVWEAEAEMIVKKVREQEEEKIMFVVVEEEWLREKILREEAKVITEEIREEKRKVVIFIVVEEEELEAEVVREVEAEESICRKIGGKDKRRRRSRGYLIYKESFGIRKTASNKSIV